MKIFWKLKIINSERLIEVSDCIIAANHISAFDPPFIGSIIPTEIHYLAKAELFKNKLAGAFLLYVNCIPIKRGRIDKSAITMVKLILRNGHSILIFPEGTRKSSKVKAGIGKFAIETKKDIIPMYIHNSTNFLKCFLGKERLKIVIGEKITAKSFAEMANIKENYKNLTDSVMEKVYELKNEC
ncbi:MAG: lysophospholipid acyltransferase family protein [Candidatus Tenebribacter burtonii]|jgi:1-acyl-sn-glycerol-3-phosphate acyltransferase|nr:lysophospholipid acyltransferase family protein [Candidatus Tenebribacter burtonii]